MNWGGTTSLNYNTFLMLGTFSIPTLEFFSNQHFYYLDLVQTKFPRVSRHPQRNVNYYLNLHFPPWRNKNTAK